ncbi:MAG: aliphatic sulfonate ABC transporter substrate-binding protein [Gallionellaceae bacterium]|nr:MAG: aliphatic sulfonate ABC transporter substrate-binding protein [Gallionellaceae bacterium]
MIVLTEGSTAYNQVSLVVKKFGWLEKEFQADAVPVKWIQSQGSNRALEYLNSGSLDFGSTAGLAAVLSKANGNPIQAIYVYARPEWASLVVTKNSPISSVKELKGKKIAATKGTDPYLFLLRTLHTAGLKKSDVEILHLQHADGRIALERGDVAAWAGLDPHTAASQLQAGSRLIYRNIEFNTYGFLNTSESFAKKYPEVVGRVIKVYEQGRKWAIEHSDELAQLISEEAKIPLNVAKLQLSRVDFSDPIPSETHVKALKAAAPILVDEELVKKGTDVNKIIDDLVIAHFAANQIHRAF